MSKRMAQMQRQEADEVGKEAECRSLQSKVEATEKQTHISGKDIGSYQVWSKSTTDTEDRDSDQSQRIFR